MTHKARLLNHLEVFADTVCTPSERQEMTQVERTDYPDGRWTETGETSVTVAGVTYSIEVAYRSDGRTTFAFRTTHPPQGYGPVVYEFDGRLPHNFGRSEAHPKRRGR